jgi:hypothetical protein
MKVLTPLFEGLVLLTSGFLPLSASDELDWDRHHLSSREVELMDEFAPIGHIEN